MLDRQEICRRAGRARMTALTPEKRREVSRLGGIARAKLYPQNAGNLLGVQRAAKKLNISSIELYRLVKAGKLRVCEHGKRGGMKFTIQEIERYLQLCN